MNRPLALALALLLALAAAAPAALAGPGVAAVAVHANTAAIAISGGGRATPYPSTIEVAGLTGGIADLDVTLRGFGRPPERRLHRRPSPLRAAPGRRMGNGHGQWA